MTHMDDLKQVAQALRLDPNSPVDKVLEALSAIQKRASEAEFWEGEAKDSLEKMEKTDRLFRENSVLRVESFYATAVQEGRITKAEADEMKAQQLAGEITEKGAKAIIASREKRDYLMRKSSLNAKDMPTDPIAEIENRANEIVAKSGGKTSKAEAQRQVLAADRDLYERYTAAVMGGGAS